MCFVQKYVPVPTGHVEGKKYLLSCWGRLLSQLDPAAAARRQYTWHQISGVGSPPSGDKATGMSSYEANESGFPLVVASRDLYVDLLFERRLTAHATHQTPTEVLTHCGRVTQICVFNTVKLGTSASSP